MSPRCRTPSFIRRIVAAFALAAALALAAGRAEAHAGLKSSDPAAGGAVRVPPAAVALMFTEGVEPSFSTVVVRNSSGADMTDGKPRRDGVPDRLAVSVKTLAPGAYTVVWHAVSVDAHKSDGTFTFTVLP